MVVSVDYQHASMTTEYVFFLYVDASQNVLRTFRYIFIGLWWWNFFSRSSYALFFRVFFIAARGFIWFILAQSTYMRGDIISKEAISKHEQVKEQLVHTYTVTKWDGRRKKGETERMLSNPIKEKKTNKKSSQVKIEQSFIFALFLFHFRWYLIFIQDFTISSIFFVYQR